MASPSVLLQADWLNPVSEVNDHGTDGWTSIPGR